MKKVYSQPYTKGEISCYWGKPPKGVFKYDMIRLHLNYGEDIWLTPDEAIDIIRALSAGVNHWLTNDKTYIHIIKAKSKAELEKL